MELLPAERNTRIKQQKTRLTERLLHRHDGAIIFCDGQTPSLNTLPYAGLSARLHREAREAGPVSIISTRVSADARPLALVFVRSSSSTFELLTLAARAWKTFAGSTVRSLLIATHDIDADLSARVLEAMASAALAATAAMPAMKSKPPRHVDLEQITLTGAGSIDTQRLVAVDRGNHVARWLTTLPPNHLSSASYRRALMTLARRQRWAFSFLNEATLTKLGAGAFLAVARANAHREAGIVRLRYRAHDRRGVVGRLALVGKGICFDTGGINLKPHKSMYQMHEDMQGSAVAVGTLLALSQLRAPYDIDCWLALTENEIGPRAYRPQEVVKAVNGVTIQVVHSDAEGRMALADTLALATREKPALMIDYSTLTGACVMALTERFSGAFTNQQQWHAPIEAAGRASGERVWTFPMDEDFDGDLDSPLADVMQCTLDSKGDHILAARFLSRFVGETPWIHLDLAAGNRSGGLGHIPTDFTGFGVRFTTGLLLDQALLRDSPRAKATRRAATGKLPGVRK